MLAARIYGAQLEARRRQEAQLRSSLIGSGDRSERIRTYNAPGDRWTDHRVHVTIGDARNVIDTVEPPFRAHTHTITQNHERISNKIAITLVAIDSYRDPDVSPTH